MCKRAYPPKIRIMRADAQKYQPFYDHFTIKQLAVASTKSEANFLEEGFTIAQKLKHPWCSYNYVSGHPYKARSWWA